MNRAERVTAIIWLCWFISCMTRNSWVIIVVCILGFFVNTFLFWKREKRALQYIVSSSFLILVVTGNLLAIFPI